MNLPRLLLMITAILLIGSWTVYAEPSPDIAEPSQVEADSTQVDGLPYSEGSPEKEQTVQDGTPIQQPNYTLTLEEAINRALEANRSVLDARDNVESSRLSIVAAKSDFELKIFPLAEAGFTDSSDEDIEENVGGGVALEKRFSTGTAVSVEPSMTRNDDLYETRVDTSLSQPLLRGRDREFNLSTVHGAEFGARTTRRSLYLTRVNTVISTVRAAYSVTRQREFMRVNEESVSRLEGHAEAARVKEKFGLATPIDVYRAEIELKQSEENLTSAREAYENAMDSLKVILAYPLERKIDVDAPLEYSLVDMGEEAAVRLAFDNRVELKQAWDGVKESERRSRIAKHSILPELNIALSFAPFGTRDSFGAELDEYIWGLSLTSTTDIRRTAERAAYDQSLLDVNSSYRSMSLTRDEIAREAKSALRSLNESRKRIDIQKEQIKNAEGKLKLAQVKFKRGMANNFDVIEAEEQLRQAQTNMISVVTDYIVGSYNLRASMGTLLEQEIGF